MKSWIGKLQQLVCVLFPQDFAKLYSEMESALKEVHLFQATILITSNLNLTSTR